MGRPSQCVRPSEKICVLFPHSLASSAFSALLFAVTEGVVEVWVGGLGGRCVFSGVRLGCLQLCSLRVW